MLIGPTAGQVDAIGINGERSMGLTERQIGPLEALKKVSGNNNIRYAVDDDMTGTPVPPDALSHDGKPGLAYAGPGGARSRRNCEFHDQGRQCPFARSQGELDRHPDGGEGRQLLALSASAGHRRQPLY